MRYHLYFNIAFVILLSIFHPHLEWPDAEHHYVEYMSGGWYPFDIFNIFDANASNVENFNFKFFSDSYVYKYKDYIQSIFLNFNRLIFAVIFLCILHVFSKKSKIPMVFNPPLVFSLFSPSQEVFSILLIVVAFYFYEKKLICLILISISLKIDRSMVAMVPFVLLFSFSSFFRKLIENNKNIFYLLLVFCFLISIFFNPASVFSYFESSGSLLNLSYEDIIYNSQFGNNKYLALIASFFGLYGSMSIRPFPFFGYYPIILMIFTICFCKSNLFYKNILIFNLSVVIILLWIIPPLSQSRYFPIITMVIWYLININFKSNLNRLVFNILVFFSTSLGIIISFFENLNSI